MTGYHLFLNMDHNDDQTGELYCEDPVYLHLSYGIYSEAVKARDLMNTLYGGKVFIDATSHSPGLDCMGSD